MKTEIMLAGKKIRLSATNVGEVDRFPLADKPDGGHFEFFITVTVLDRRTSFKYFTSVRDYEEGKNEMSSDDIKTAFYNFLTDAQLGSDTFENFCAELGYDTDSRKAEKIWKACRLSAKKIENLRLGDVYSLSNEFSESYPDSI